MKKAISNSYMEAVVISGTSLCHAANQSDFDRLKRAFAERFAIPTELTLEL